jgi:branched-chain amino acid transport system permease protein
MRYSHLEKNIMNKRLFLMIATLLVLGGLSGLAPTLGWLSNYYQLICMTIGINIILAVSLNLVNGFLGEFSVGHAGFMAIGAYISSFFSLHVFSSQAFLISTIIAAVAAGMAGFVIAVLSFKTRGDYLAILTLAFVMIVKSVLENLDIVGGPRGLPGIPKLTTLPWVFFWLLITLIVLRNLVDSRFGRNMLAIREDELAAKLMGVDTRKTKILAFSVSAFFTGIAGALYAHLLQFINPAVFNLEKSTDMLIMVYLGGAGSLTGSILGGTIYTLLLELLRPLAEWRMIFMPLLLILLMIFRPAGIMGLKEWSIFRRKAKIPAVSAGKQISSI